MRYKSSSGTNAKFEALLPSIEQEVNEENLNRFFESMVERQNVWYRRFIKKQPFPWTDDPFFRDYYFTNVYRELDKNSQWEIKNIISYDEIPLKERLWMMIFFRLQNNPKFFDYYSVIREFQYPMPLLEEFDEEFYHIILSDYRERKGNPYTSAYLINTMCCPGKKRDECFAYKIIPHVRDNIDELFDMICNIHTKPKELIKFLNTWPSISNFVSHELYISMCYFSRYSKKPLFEWDQNDYTNVGPGASLGIRLIFPSTIASKQEEKIYKLRDMSEQFLPRLKFKYLSYNDLKKTYSVKKKGEITLHQIEMWLCEFSKLWKMENNVGKQRSKYKPKNS